MKSRIAILPITTCLLVAGVCLGEKADFPGEAEEKATHILTGTVAAIYSKITRTEANETVYYVAEVRVENVEKGEGIRPGQLAYVRYWHHLKWLEKGPIAPGPSGHANIPKEGDKRRMCLVRGADGSLDVYYVSGFKNPEEKLK